MKLGIIGAGNMGSALGKSWAEKGHEVKFSYSRNPEVLAQLGRYHSFTSSGSVAETIQFGEVILLSIPYLQLREVLTDTSLFQGKTVITCVSGLVPDFTGERIGLNSDLKISVAETIANALPGAMVVEAFNTTFAEVINAIRLHPPAEAPSVFYCGDSTTDKQIVRQLIADAGFEAVDAGALTTARALETFATAWVQLSVVARKFPSIGLKTVELN
jgi:predicted dinucleotide-binding enzyme